MPIVLYVVVSLFAIFVINKWRRLPFQDPLFWSAIVLVYIGPLTVMVARFAGTTGITTYAGSVVCGLLSLLIATAANTRSGQTSKAASVVRFTLIIIAASMAVAPLLNGDQATLPLRDLPTYFTLLLVGALSRDRQTINRFLGGVLWAIVVTCVGSIVLYGSYPLLVTTNFSSLDGIPLLQSGRLTGPFGHPNALGSFAAAGAALSLIRIEHKVRYLVYVICLLAVLLTDQRSALLAGVACGVVEMAWPKKATALTWLRTTLLSLGLALLLATDMLREFFSSVLSRREASVESRQQVYDYVFSHLDEILPSGIGVNGLYDRTFRLVSLAGFSHAHNAWLTFVVAGGILGGLLFVLLTILAVTRTLSRSDRDLFIPLVGVLALCIAESPVFPGSNWTITPVAAVTMLIISQALVNDKSSALVSPRKSVSKKDAHDRSLLWL